MHPVILAAGRGSRLGELTAERPKLFVDVDGRSIYEHQLDVLESYFDEATVVLGHGFESADPPEIRRHLDVGAAISVDHVLLEEWATVENAASLRAAIDHHRTVRGDSTDPGDLFVLCGDVIFADEAIRRVVDTFAGRDRQDGYNAVGCIHGRQDEMTAVRYDEAGEITAYGAITGHQETGMFVLHASHIAGARRLLATNEDSWFPFVFERLPSRRVEIPEWSHHEINTPAHLEQAPDRLPFEPVAADGDPERG